MSTDSSEKNSRTTAAASEETKHGLAAPVGAGRGRLWAFAAELWMVGVLAMFFVLRILESHTVRRLLGRIGLTHAG